MHRLITFTIAGFVAQLVDGSLGMGYGLTSTSFLVTAGTAAAAASATATVHLAEVGTSLASGVAHHRFGNVDWRAVRWLAVPGAIGALAGATLLSSIPASIATPWTATVLIVLGVWVVARAQRTRMTPAGERQRHGRRFLAVLGVGAGFLDAAGGGGWGPLGTSTLLARGRMEPREIIGTVSTSEFLVSLGASVGFLIALPWREIDMALVAALLAAGAVAAPVAAWLTRHLDRRTLSRAVGLFLVATNARTLMAVAGVPGAVLSTSAVLLAGAWVAMAAYLAHRALRSSRRRESELTLLAVAAGEAAA